MRLLRPFWPRLRGKEAASDTRWGAGRGGAPAREEERPGLGGRDSSPQACVGWPGGGVLPAAAAACSPASVSPLFRAGPRARLQPGFDSGRRPSEPVIEPGVASWEWGPRAGEPVWEAEGTRPSQVVGGGVAVTTVRTWLGQGRGVAGALRGSASPSSGPSPAPGSSQTPGQHRTPFSSGPPSLLAPGQLCLGAPHSGRAVSQPPKGRSGWALRDV